MAQPSLAPLYLLDMLSAYCHAQVRPLMFIYFLYHLENSVYAWLVLLAQSFETPQFDQTSSFYPSYSLIFNACFIMNTVCFFSLLHYFLFIPFSHYCAIYFIAKCPCVYRKMLINKIMFETLYRHNPPPQKLCNID